MDTFSVASSSRSRLGHLARCLGVVLLAAGLFAISSNALADSNTVVYQARLSPLGVTNATVDKITGIGKATATLSGNRLTVEATFEGLTGTATAANVRRGRMGIPGPIVFELHAPNASSGTMTATIELTPDQLTDLREARLYLQIHSEAAPEGSIRGWLLPAKR